MAAASLSDVAVTARVVPLAVALHRDRFRQANLGSLRLIDRRFFKMTSSIQNMIDDDDGGMSSWQRLQYFALCS